MRVTQEIDNYLRYLVNKYFVFNQLAEMDESNTIQDIDIIKANMKIDVKKITDNNMNELTKMLFSTFLFYNICIKDEYGTFGSRLVDPEVIYLHYKKYKCAIGSSSRERENSLVLNEGLDTSDTYYEDSFDTVTTNDLQSLFGNFLNTGSSCDKYRYEYRFEFTTDGKKYKFSLYDYVDDGGEFYPVDDIYWHIASNTDKKKVIACFKKYIIAKVAKSKEPDCC